MLKSVCGIADGMAVLAEPPTSVPPPGAAPLWGGQAPTGARPRPTLAVASVDGEPLEPLSRRLLRLAGLLSALLILVVANSLLRSEEDPFNPVAVAAEHTSNCPGFRFNAFIVYSSPALPSSITASGSGAYNAQTKRTRVELSLNSSMTGQLHIVEISDSDYTYESGTIVADQLPPGKEWVKTSKAVEDGETPSADFDESMEMLDSSGGVHIVGHESVNGKMARRYRAEIPLDKFVELLREKGQDEAADAYESLRGVAPTGISAEVWIDRKNVLRRLRMVMPVPSDDGDPPFTMDMRMDLFDYRAKPNIQLPHGDSVVDGPLDSSGTSTASVS